MNKLSITHSGIIISVVGTILVQAGFSEVCSNEIIKNVPLLIGSVVAWYGRYRQGDVSLLGVKK